MTQGTTSVVITDLPPLLHESMYCECNTHRDALNVLIYLPETVTDVHVFAKDVTGNERAVSSSGFVVDSTPPVVRNTGTPPVDDFANCAVVSSDGNISLQATWQPFDDFESNLVCDLLEHELSLC